MSAENVITQCRQYLCGKAHYGQNVNKITIMNNKITGYRLYYYPLH